MLETVEESRRFLQRFPEIVLRHCRVISSIVLGPRFEFTAESQRRMDDLAIGSRVRADLAINRSTSDLELEVVARDGAVAIQGKVAITAQIDEVKRVASAASGVASVNIEKLVPPIRV